MVKVTEVTIKEQREIGIFLLKGFVEEQDLTVDSF